VSLNTSLSQHSSNFVLFVDLPPLPTDASFSSSFDFLSPPLPDDRNNVEQFCSEVPNSKYSSWGGHVGGACHVNVLNMTIGESSEPLSLSLSRARDDLEVVGSDLVVGGKDWEQAGER